MWFDFIYRLYVLFRRIFNFSKNVAFLPLKYDHHVVWDIHEKYLQYRTAPPLPGKIIHVINRRPAYFIKHHYPYISELENIFSLLPREIQRCGKYSDIFDALHTELNSKELKALIFQSPGALAVNERFLKGSQVHREMIPVVPAAIEPRTEISGHIEKGHVKFLVFASRFFEKGLHILFAAANRVLDSKRHYQFTLVTSKPPAYFLPSNIVNLVMPCPTLRDRRTLYTGHDYILNLSLGDSLGVFLDSLRFGTPMIGYPGQHGSYFCHPNSSIMLPSPIFIYGPGFFRDYAVFDFESYLEKQEQEGFFYEAKNQLTDTLNDVDDVDKYLSRIEHLREFAGNFRATDWYSKIKNFYLQF